MKFDPLTWSTDTYRCVFYFIHNHLYTGSCCTDTPWATSPLTLQSTLHCELTVQNALTNHGHECLNRKMAGRPVPRHSQNSNMFTLNKHITMIYHWTKKCFPGGEDKWNIVSRVGFQTTPLAFPVSMLPISPLRLPDITTTSMPTCLCASLT